MDDLPLVRSLVAKLATGLTTPVSCKIRMFPKLEDTLAYARMIEEAGCCLLAVHGRTRDQKDGKAIRADWEVIKAVKSALRIPVVANGNIRWLEDVDECISVTGVDGVMSAESLLENPALFAGYRMKPLDSSAGEPSWKYSLDEPTLVLEYLDLCEKYPVPARMIRAHVHRTLGPWFRRYPELREELNKEHKITVEWLKDMVHRLISRHKASVTTKEPEMLDQIVSNGVAQPALAVEAGIGAA
jgi:tRNA-dihydrouridine synthase 1